MVKSDIDLLLASARNRSSAGCKVTAALDSLDAATRAKIDAWLPVFASAAGCVHAAESTFESLPAPAAGRCSIHTVRDPLGIVVLASGMVLAPLELIASDPRPASVPVLSWPATICELLGCAALTTA